MDEELLARQTPQALEAEQSVLGSMLIDERCVPDVVGMLQPEDFYLRQNREIYETIYTMFNFSEKIDPVTVLNKMKERGVYDEERSYDYLAQLLKITPTAANVKQYCTIVHDKSLLRALAAASSEITDMVYEGVGTAQEMLEVSEKKIYSLRRGNTGDSLQHIGKVMINVYDRLEELAASGSEIPGLSTGLHDLDRKINGLNMTKPFGDAAIAAMSVVNRYSNFLICVGLGIGQGFQPVASFNYQARKYDRVKKGLVFTMCFGLVFIGSFSVISMICAEDIIGIFQKSEAVIAIGSTALRYTAIGMLFVPFSVPVNMLYQSIQQPTISSVLSLIRSGAVTIPMLLIGVPLLGLPGIQIAQPTADVIAGLLSIPFIIRFLKKTPAE